ncbi:branched-chain amino acid ABC transporter permease [Brucella lupini]|uniref:Branched-chain amino acid ABC transporter permease n=1 Tax=Brucella lupini TaxID=255457 RepID=A0A256GD05_9HYPH|nr:branched-chain amino acid ABC transporter permease [Brucella lupini]KAB2698706.1 branched-chain amino acid ABC transporter permease [Brucella lupini]OYR24918.1 branched-chain amino acid transport system / permease component family protein [Brucella lupini]
MDFMLFSLLNGIAYGLLLFMISSGLTLIFGMMGVLNFAHASFYMLGAYLAFAISGRFGFVAGVIAATILVASMGMLIERFLLRKVHLFGHGHELLLTFGLALVIDEVIKLFFGNFPVNYTVPSALDFSAFTLSGMSYPFYRLFIALVAIAMFTILFLLLRHTRIGLIVRAAERAPTMAQALGHDVPTIFTGVFGLGAGLAGLAGAVAGAFYPTNPNMALELGAIVFVVVVIGGLGSLAGSLIASLGIGVLTSLTVGIDFRLADLAAGVGLGDWANEVGGLMTVPISVLSGAVPFILMLLVLLTRPAGLLGARN